MKTVMKSVLVWVALTTFLACSKEDNSTNEAQGSSSLIVRMVDAPGDYDAVYVDVEDVLVKYNGEENEISLGQAHAGIYNLLELTGGTSALLVDDEIPAGDISQIRLVLGNNNTVVVDGQSYPLDTPSAQQSGLKLQVHQTFEDGILYEFILDFNVDQSIVTQGNGNFSLRPVIHASLNAETGIIVGQVLPLGIQTLVTASNGTTEISTYTSATGDYSLYGLPQGTYEVTFQADTAFGFPPVTISNVEVVAGLATQVEPVNFE